LLLAIAALLAVTLKRALQPSFESLADSFQQRIDSMFAQGNMHRFRISGP
jgi:hypothetical protein